MPAGRGPAERKEGLNRDGRGIAAIERLSVDLRDFREVLVGDPAPPTPSEFELRLKRSQRVRRVFPAREIPDHRVTFANPAGSSGWRRRGRDDLFEESVEPEPEILRLDASALIAWHRRDREAPGHTFHDAHHEIEQYGHLAGRRIVVPVPALAALLLGVDTHADGFGAQPNDAEASRDVVERTRDDGDVC